MTIQQAIQKAIEGGWKNILPTITTKDSDIGEVMNALLLWQMLPLATGDPLFWQALGKAMGWEERRCTCEDYSSNCRCQFTWLYHWHCFLDILADGGSPESFFASLSPNNQPEP
jgi:hypothetical protein